MATGHGSKSKGADMTLQEILERIQSIQSQLGEDNTAGALDDLNKLEDDLTVAVEKPQAMTEKEEDRNTFMSYNCSFFDIKDQMDAAGIISVKTNLHKTEVYKKTKELPKIRKLQKEIRVLINKFESKKKLLVTRPLKMKRLGLAEFQVVEAMDRAKYIIQAKAMDPKTWSKNMTAAQVKGEVIQELFEIYKIILEKVPQMKPSVLGKFAHKYEMPKSIAKFKNVFNGETEEEKIIPMFMSDIRAKTIKVPHDHLGYVDKTVKTAWFDVLKDSYFTHTEWIYGALKRHEFLKTYPRQSISSLVKYNVN